MANYSFEISNSRDSRKNNVKADEHHNYIERVGKYSPNFELDKKSYSAESHLEYVQRQKAFSKKVEYEDLVCSEDKNMPSWAKENANLFWQSSEKYERANGRTYTEFLLSLPHELSDDENKVLVDKFCQDTFGESFVYSYGIHSKPSSEIDIQNIHAHIMFCERKLDGIERNAEQFFKRYNPKFPERGGARKDRFWNDRKMFSIVRKSWEKHLNEILEEKGIEKVSCKSLEIQKLEAKMAGDILREEFFNRPAVNCSGKILMKLEKYGIDKLTKKEKEEYDLYLVAKELRKLHLEEYKTKLAEKENIKIEEISFDTRDIILDRAKFSVYESKKNIENIDEFNSYEIQKYEANSNLLGLDILYKEDSKNIKQDIEFEVLSSINFNNNNFSFEKKYQEDYSNLRHDNFNFVIEEIEEIEKNQKDFLLKLNELRIKKKELIKNYKNEFMEVDFYYSLKALNELSTVSTEKTSKEVLHLFINKHKEINDLDKKIENYSGENKPRLLKKLFNNKSSNESIETLKNKKRETTEWLEKKTEDLATHYPKLYKDFIKEKLNLIETDRCNNNKEYLIQKEKFEKFNRDYSLIKDEIEVYETAIKYAGETLVMLDRKKSEENKLKNINNIESIKNKKINIIPDDIFEEKEKSTLEKYKDNIKDYILNTAELEKTNSLISTYTSILSNEDKIKNVSVKRNISISKLIQGYKNSLIDLEEKLNNVKISTDKIYSKVLIEKSNLTINENKMVYTEILDAIEKDKKHLFAKLDILPKGPDRNKIFTKIKSLNDQKNSLNIFFNEFTNNKNEKTKERKEFKKFSISKEKIKDKEYKKPLVRAKKDDEDLNKAKGKGIKNTVIPKKNKDWEDYINGY